MVASNAYSLAQPPTVESLLRLHESAVAEVLQAARDHVARNPHVRRAAEDAPLDALFALRHVLSAPKHSAASSAANVIKTLEWRSKNFEALKAAQNGILPKDERIRDVSLKGYQGDVGGMHPLFIGRVGLVKPGRIVELLSHDEIVLYFLCGNEYTYHIADQNTRRLGLLCKTITVFDMEGFSLLCLNRRFTLAHGASSHLSSVYYPQHVGKTAVLNAGVMFKMLVAVAKTFMSSSIIKKVGACGRTKANSDPRDCPFLAQFLDGPGRRHGAEVVPKYLGGSIDTVPSLLTQEEQDAQRAQKAKASDASD